MSKFILKRIFLGLVTFFVIITVVFFLVNLSPGSPIDKNDFPNDQDFQQALKALGLDKSSWDRFWIYFADLFTGKGFGRIYKEVGESSIPKLFFSPLKYTLWITIPSLFFAMIFGVSLGVLAGYKKGTWVDTSINILVIFFIGVPTFVLASVFLGFGHILGLPTSFVSIEDGGLGQFLASLVLPILVLGLSSMAFYTFITRNEMVTLLNSTQVIIARSKGLGEFAIFKKHIIRNGMIPLLSLILSSLIFLLGGSIVIETFFQVPGSSGIIIASIRNSEYNIIMFYTMFYVGLGIVINLILDISYVIIDPRIKYNSFSEFKLVRKIKTLFNKRVILRKVSNNQLQKGGE